MKECPKFPLPTVFQNRNIDPSNLSYLFQYVTKSLKRKIVHTLYPECLMNIYTKFYHPTIFQS